MSISMLNDLPTVGIIGTAGRGSDAKKLNKDIYDKMYKVACDLVGRDSVYLVSGGAAWCDHLAVRMFLDRKLNHRLTLQLPCKFGNRQFEEYEVYNGMNIGKVSNYYHKKFSTTVGINSLEEIDTAIHSGCDVEFGKGFFDRNLQIAKADQLIAFTYGSGAKLKDGGTSHTADNYIANGGKELYHVDLHDFRIYKTGECTAGQ